MKHRVELRVVLFLFLTCSIGVSSLKAQEKRLLTLQEAISLSIKNSKQLKGSEAKIEEAQAALKEALDRRLPDASVSGSYLRVNNPTVDFKLKSNNSGNNGGGGNTSATPVTVNQAAYAMANVSLPIYSGFRIRYGIEASKYLEEATKLDADNDRQAVILNTIDVYNNVYKARAAVDVINQSLIEAKQRVVDFTNLEKNGLMARNDLLKAQLQQSNIELTLLDAQNNWKLANLSIDLLLGLPDNTEIVPDSASMSLVADQRNVQDYVQAAYQNRKDLSALDQRKLAAITNVKATKGEMYPSVALTGGYVAMDIPKVLTVYNAVNVGLGVQYNIGSLWKTNAKIQQAKARQRQLEVSEEELNDAIHLQVSQAYQNYLSEQKKIEVYATAVAQAEENFRIVQNKFNNSLATTTDLLDANVAQLQARLNYKISQSDVFVGYNRLLQAAGLLNINENK